MRKFEVIKELPGIPLGVVLFKEDNGDTLEDCDGRPTGLVLVDGPDGPLLRMQGGDRLADFDDWLEEIEPEYKRWRAENGGDYYTVDSDLIVFSANETDSIAAEYRYRYGNYFKTREEAQALADYLKAVAVVRDDAKGFTPIWSGEEPRPCYVYYSWWRKQLDVESTGIAFNNGAFGLPYFATEDDARASIEKHRAEWLTIFGIKNEEEE